MFRFTILLFTFFSCNFSFAQVKLNRSHHHFGMIDGKSERFVDFILTNKSPKKIFILRIDADREFASLISNKTLEPDSSATIRIQFNPTEKGKINKSIGVYISSQNDPIQITFSGEVVDMPRIAQLDCPSFNTVSAASLTPSFLLRVLIIDKLTGLPIEKADLKMLNMGLAKYQFTTDKEGMIVQQVLIGNYYFVANAEEYIGSEFEAYINARNNNLVIELMPKNVNPIDPEPLDSLFYVEQPIEPLVDPGREDEWVGRDSLKPVEEKIITKVEEPIKIEPKIENTELFTETNYAKNNIVFLIDVSGSMLSDGKLELLKSSMIELAKMLRPVDKISIVVYASNARIVLSPIAGDQQQIVIEKIQQMEGGGNTAGSEGMKMAYDLAYRNFVPDGNNTVIMATDGAFNLYTSDVGPMVKRYQKKGIHTSVLGIKNTERDAKSMQTIAALGAGRYIAINTFDEAQILLIEEIKIGSRRL